MDHVGPVADLIDPYLDGSVNQANGGRKQSGCELVIWWLESHPGRWALVGEGGVGLGKGAVVSLGYTLGTTARRDELQRTYAQKPHPLGETLKEAMKRGTPRPRLTREALALPEHRGHDSFNWTPEELADACRVARKSLYS